jgi:hypothetical protein
LIRAPGHFPPRVVTSSGEWVTSGGKSAGTDHRRSEPTTRATRDDNPQQEDDHPVAA